MALKTFEDYSDRDLRALITYLMEMRKRKFGTLPGAPESSPTSFSDEDDAQHDLEIKETRDAAQAYCDAKREGKRVRTYSQETQAQREALEETRSWLVRRRRSKVRK